MMKILKGKYMKSLAWTPETLMKNKIKRLYSEVIRNLLIMQDQFIV